MTTSRNPGLRHLKTAVLCSFSLALTRPGYAAPALPTLQGVPANIATNIQRQLSATQSSKLSVKNLKKQAAEAIAPYGYFNPKLRCVNKKTSQSPCTTLQITLGKPTLWQHINWTITGAGASNKAFKNFARTTQVHNGQPMQIDALNQSLSQLFSLASNQGFFKAKLISRRIRVNRARRTAQLDVHFDTGPIFYFGSTTFNTTPLKPSLVQRFVPYKKGEAYRSAVVQSMHNALSQSGYFKRVTANPRIHPQTHRVDLHVKLIMNPPTTYRFGAGYGSDTGPRIMAQLQKNRLNACGAQLAAATSLSMISQSLQVRYTLPGSNPAQQQWFIQAGIGQSHQTQGQSFSQKITLGYTSHLFGWTSSLSLSGLKEQYNLVNQPQVSTMLMMPTLALSRNTLWGAWQTQLQLNFNGGARLLFAKHPFFQAQASIHALGSFHHDDSRLLLRSRIGYTRIDALNHLPFSLQLLAGGAQSVRGYSYNDLGPGTHLLEGSVEWQQRLYRNLYATAFIDAASIGSHWAGPTYSGAGPGLLLQTPIGALEVTAAKPLNNPQKSWMFQFSLTPNLHLGDDA